MEKEIKGNSEGSTTREDRMTWGQRLEKRGTKKKSNNVGLQDQHLSPNDLQEISP